MHKLFIAIVSLSLVFANYSTVQAVEPLEPSIQNSYQFEASIGESGLGKDLSFLAFDGELQLGLPAGRISAPTVISLNRNEESVTAPTGFQAATVTYQITIPSAAFVNGNYYVSFKSSGSAQLKKIHFFNTESNLWQPILSNENFGKGLVSATLFSPSIKLAVFESSKTIVTGRASWYRYKNGLFAASPDFPKGSRLRVINLDNRKSVDVVINDHGPDRSKHPDRVVDLDAVAFARLASLGQGTIRIAIEELSAQATPAPLKPVMSDEPVLSAKAALIFNSADKKVMWSKAENTVIPMASLSKLAAVKVFLETKPDLKKVVKYSVKDEQFNAKYVDPAQSARLRLKDGDTVTIKDLVFASLIGSTNNTVESLVRVSGLSRDVFIARMNKRVKEWGATQTFFVEPTGLSPKNVTTARDYVIIARVAFLDPIMSTASVMPSYTVKTINTKVSHSFKNTNLIARTQGSPLLGSKTGYLEEAGYCLVTKWPTEKNKNIIIVLFGEPSRQASTDDTKKLVAFASKIID